MPCKARWMSGTQLTAGGVNRNSSHRGGKRDDLGGMYFRSSWEANWARYLNWRKERGEIAGWQYEPDTFAFEGIKRGSRFYTPDFKVFAPDGTFEYDEVKGWMDPASATKLRRMAKYHPSIRVHIVDSPRYRAVAKVMAKVIPGWETYE